MLENRNPIRDSWLADRCSSPQDLFDISGKRVLITGGGQGLGRTIGTGFAEAGARLFISSRDREVATEAAESLSAVDTEPCVGLVADLSTEAGCRRLVEDLTEHVDSLDVLINNAGATSGAPIDEHDDEVWDRVLAVNTKAVFHLIRFLLPLLRAAGSPDSPARIINVGSIAGSGVSVRSNYAYSASKAAVHHMTRHLALNLAPTITVNAIAPGPFKSAMTEALPDDYLEELNSGAPLRGLGRADDIVGGARYLSSRASANVTGLVLPLDGGLTTTTW